MPSKIAINGFGRIGRLVFRIASQRDLEIAAINDLTDPKTLAYLLKYDSTHGRFPGTVEVDGDNLVVNGRKIRVLKVKDPKTLPWGEMGIDVVIEGTGVFRSLEECKWHIEAGARKVILTAPSKGDVDATVVLGVNHDTLKDDHIVVSNASCTTNCLAPMVKVLHDNFGVISGTMTTIHSYTNDQSILDFPHSDLRRARAAAVSIIPTTTGAAVAVGKVIPELNGKLDGYALRVPLQDGSITDFVAHVDKKTTADEVNKCMQAASESYLKGIMEYCEDPIVSADIIGNSYSCILDSMLTMVVNGNMVKVVGWYDNEWGYSSRVVDLIDKIV